MPNIEILKKVKIFDGLVTAELFQIGSICEELAFPEYYVIFEEDSSSDELYILVKGKVELKLKVPGKDNWMTLTKMHPGDVFGEFALIDQSPRSAAAIAFTEIMLYIIKRDDFFKLIDDNPRIGSVIMQNLARLLVERLRATDSELKNHIVWQLVEAGEELD
ncbi:MAG: hypothetical protein A2161_01125 [Candidatus Schekmanbacteria bacterium RBG_13_48_7]|uniref:Cyclic nucleotide-binding domain-containing protein n=1 Tax=Candidatus Schekmanbacteria bacterium RBG_13_48_7 TaxID=1817878 RepID=A0A1F7RZJ9_9BACT|nr:MAG: hypothetical protein A2161_01125 [Candidatus Schekmanbacteria bacterium RBG_13_48_7]